MRPCWRGLKLRALRSIALPAASWNKFTSQLTHSGRPFETGRGIMAKYGPAPSAEEIDANRAEMFRGFAQDF
jgi:hypothetical protein